MKKTTVEIIIETEEIFIMRKSGERVRALCERCGDEVKLFLPPPVIEEQEMANQCPQLKEKNHES
jgi:rRNA-processing protein FCF1